jgi:hypothetical protein
MVYHYISICKAYVSAREISLRFPYFRPDIFLEAARRLGKDATKCLVFPGTDSGARDELPQIGAWKIWVCLKIWYIPNYSHLIGIMIINHWD